MMVTFISQCEKKALNRTRRVLDSFANRIGDNAWQTVITEAGLIAVKTLLRRTATKNTAVSCHWIRSRSRSELVWIVGNRDKFNTEGIVPVNFTNRRKSKSASNAGAKKTRPRRPMVLTMYWMMNIRKRMYATCRRSATTIPARAAAAGSTRNVVLGRC